MYALLNPDRTIRGYTNDAPVEGGVKIVGGKPLVVPVVEEGDEYDPVTEVREGPEMVVEDDRVVSLYTVRAKNEDEVGAMIAAKDREIEREFQRLCYLPITFSVGGVSYEWHADAEAVENIMGVLLAYQVQSHVGLTLPDPRTWTPVGHDTPVSIYHAELVGLGLAIAARKDALFAIKKAKQAALNAMTDPADVAAVDPLTGWEIT